MGQETSQFKAKLGKLLSAWIPNLWEGEHLLQWGPQKKGPKSKDFRLWDPQGDILQFTLSAVRDSGTLQW